MSAGWQVTVELCPTVRFFNALPVPVAVQATPSLPLPSPVPPVSLPHASLPLTPPNLSTPSFDDWQPGQHLTSDALSQSQALVSKTLNPEGAAACALHGSAPPCPPVLVRAGEERELAVPRGFQLLVTADVAPAGYSAAAGNGDMQDYGYTRATGGHASGTVDCASTGQGGDSCAASTGGVHGSTGSASARSSCTLGSSDELAAGVWSEAVSLALPWNDCPQLQRHSMARGRRRGGGSGKEQQVEQQVRNEATKGGTNARGVFESVSSSGIDVAVASEEAAPSLTAAGGSADDAYVPAQSPVLVPGQACVVNLPCSRVSRSSNSCFPALTVSEPAASPVHRAAASASAAAVGGGRGDGGVRGRGRGGGGGLPMPVGVSCLLTCSRHCTDAHTTRLLLQQVQQQQHREEGDEAENSSLARPSSSRGNKQGHETLHRTSSRGSNTGSPQSGAGSNSSRATSSGATASRANSSKGLLHDRHYSSSYITDFDTCASLPLSSYTSAPFSSAPSITPPPSSTPSPVLVGKPGLPKSDKMEGKITSRPERQGRRSVRGSSLSPSPSHSSRSMYQWFEQTPVPPPSPSMLISLLPLAVLHNHLPCPVALSTTPDPSPDATAPPGGSVLFTWPPPDCLSGDLASSGSSMRQSESSAVGRSRAGGLCGSSISGNRGSWSEEDGNRSSSRAISSSSNSRQRGLSGTGTVVGGR